MSYQIIHGEEEFTRTEEISKLKARFTQAGLGDLNSTSLDGHKLSILHLREACETMPFLANRRLVLVYGLLQRFDPAGKSEGEESDTETTAIDPVFTKELVGFLTLVPAFTHLVFCETKLLSARNPVLKHAQSDKDAVIKQCDKPGNDTLSGWIMRQAKSKNLLIAGDAARELAKQVGNNLRQLDTELDKLAAFANYRTIQVEHVNGLITENLEARIFSLVDALGRRERRAALRELEVLYTTGAHPLYILTMVVRQYRMLIMAKELLDERHSNNQMLMQELKVRDFVADKLQQQARLYHMAELLTIYSRLLQIDQQIKTGRINGELALELLVVEFCWGVQQGRNPERTRRASPSSSASPEVRSR
ncbi:MAG: DNA polymerase III subunit delta [Anaerolineae bacterium]